MPNVKFSQFTAVNPVASTGFIVGYDSVTNLNTRVTLANLAASFAPYIVYVDALNFDLSPTASPAAGQIAYQGNTGTLSYLLNSSQVRCDIGQQLYAYVHNAEAVQINKGQPVYLFSSSGNKASVKLANNSSDATSAKTLGLAAENIPANQNGMVICQGMLDKVSTTGFTDGDLIYVGATAGSITNVKPYAPNHLVYLGIIEIGGSNNNGQIYVRAQNGYELDEIHDVDLITTPPVNNDILTYVTGTSNLWKPRSISSILGYTPTGGSGTSNEIAYFTGASTLGSLTTSTYPSLAELSYVKGVTSALQTQIGAKQDKSIAAYSILANNTNAAADMVVQVFKSFPSQTYTGTIAWTGGTAPSGTTNHSYRWQQVGNAVIINISLVYSVAGGSTSQVTMDLPLDAPTPVIPSGLSGNSSLIYPGSGHMSATLSLSANTHRCGLQTNSTNTGFQIINVSSAGNYRYVEVTANYFTA